MTDVALADALAKGGAARGGPAVQGNAKAGARLQRERARRRTRRRSINTDKADDALTVLQANAELAPNHAPTYVAMAQAYAKKNDKDNQIKSAREGRAARSEQSAAEAAAGSVERGDRRGGRQSGRKRRKGPLRTIDNSDAALGQYAIEGRMVRSLLVQD